MILDFKDEALCDSINHIVSGLLPHDNYSPEAFETLYPALLAVLPTANTRGAYFALFTIFEKYSDLANALPEGKFKVSIDRDRFCGTLSNNIPDLIIEPNADIKTIMAEEGKNADIAIPTVHNEMMGILYEKTVAVYDACFELKQSYESATAEIINLQSIIKANLIETGLGIQRAIMATGFRDGRLNYVGPTGWIDFVQNQAREISEMGFGDDGTFKCDSITLAPRIKKVIEDQKKPLGYYGIPVLDDRTPLLQHRLAVMVAQENTGKTQVLVKLTASLIREGVAPFYACGEMTSEALVAKVISSYIHQEYGLFYESDCIAGEHYEELTPEDKQIVNTATARVLTSGLQVCTDLEYDNVTAKVLTAYREGCKAIFIDHTQSLRGRGKRTMPELVTSLSLDLRELKNKLPIYICVASHPSANLKDIQQKEKVKKLHISPTAQSSTLSTEADEVFILSSDEYLDRQGLLKWFTYKRRGAEVPGPVYIKKMFNVASYVWDAKYQGADAIDGDEIDDLLLDDDNQYADSDYSIKMD